MKIVTVLVFVVVAWESVARCEGKNETLKADDKSPDAGTGLTCNLLGQGEISALGSLLMKLGLAMTVDGVKTLVLKLNSGLGGLLLGPGVSGSNGLTAFLNRLVVYLVGEPLDLDSLVISLVAVINSLIQCLTYPLP